MSGLVSKETRPVFLVIDESMMFDQYPYDYMKKTGPIWGHVQPRMTITH